MSVLKKEKEWLVSEEAKELKRKLAEKKRISEDEIIWVGKETQNDWETFAYRPHRMVLNYVCDEIKKEFPDQYTDSGAVFKEFLKANFTGQLMTIARLVEKTFGEGSFRLLGNMGTKNNDAVLCFETMKKERSRKVRAEK